MVQNGVSVTCREVGTPRIDAVVLVHTDGGTDVLCPRTQNEGVTCDNLKHKCPYKRGV